MAFAKEVVCCKWKRSENDFLVDPLDKQSYCAACWQGWLHSQPKRSSKDSLQICETSLKSSKSEESTEKVRKDQQLSTDYHSDGAVVVCEVLEGVVHTNGNLYLLDKSRNSVYSTERTDSGDLVPVGVFIEGEILLNDSSKTSSEFPFKVDPADNCETPMEAYEDLAPVLHILSNLLKKKPENLRIY
eukprot:IDg13694t1